MRRLTQRLTLRTRATLLATLIAGVTLTVAAVALVLTLESRLTNAADDLSRSRASDLLELAESGALPDTLTNVGDDGFAQVVTADGAVVASSANVEGKPPVTDLDPGEGFAVTTVEAYPSYSRCWPAAPGWSWAGRCAGWTGSAPRSTRSPRTGSTAGCPSRPSTTRSDGWP